jgi:hypothetical protein
LGSWGSRITRRSYSNIKTLEIEVIRYCMMALLSGIREGCYWETIFVRRRESER